MNKPVDASQLGAVSSEVLGRSSAMSVVVPERVILVGPLPPPFGGMANQTRQLAELLRSAGAEVEVVQNNAVYRPSWVGRVPVLRALFRLLPYIAHLLSACRRGGVMHLMANSGWSWHLFAAPAILVARVCRVPVVVNYRGGEAEAFLASQARFVMPVLRKASALAVPSGFLQAVFARYGVSAAIVPNVVDLGLFATTAVREAPNQAAPHLLVARNLEGIYDNATALRAFALLRQRFPGARLSVAGDGPERGALLALADQLGIAQATVFTGRLDRQAMAGLYATADLMINPSRVDNTPNSVLEAWASGVPVVSTRVGGVPFLVNEDVDAVLVPVADAAAMAAAMISVLEDGERWAALRAAGLVSAQRNTWSAVRGVLFEVYRDVAAGEFRPLAEGGR